MSRRILVTSAGSGPSNNLMRSLVHGDATTELVGCHSDRFLLKKSPAARNFLTPAPGSSADGASVQFGHALRLVIKQAHIDLIIPGNDRDAAAVAEIRDAASLGARTFLPALSTIRACQDKAAVSAALRSHGIPAPRTFPIICNDSLHAAWSELEPRGLAWCRIRRGFASRGATKVRDPEQAWHWISYWHTMRGVPVEDFTLCEYLPGRDFNVQTLWQNGKPVLVKMCERLSYLNAEHHPSGMASTPALAKTVWEPEAVKACESALQVIDGCATGVFSIDLKENDDGVPCITEINAGRFAMITNIHDLTGRHNMAATYVKLAFGGLSEVTDPYDDPGEHYLIRDLDTLPTILPANALFEGIEKAGLGP